MSNTAQIQPNDNVFKRLIENQYETVIPLLFPQLCPTRIRERPIEILLPPRRMDRVFLMDTPLGRIVLDLEIEASAKKTRFSISRRMLIYHACLLDEYNSRDEGIPVLTMVLYPFEVPPGQPRLVETYGDEELLRFPYRELPLRSLDARTFIQAHAVPMYALLPAMSGGDSAELLCSAFDEMVNYYAEEEDLLHDELLCFLVLLNRAGQLEGEELEKVKQRIYKYDPILEEDPWVKECMRKSEDKGKAEGKAEGKLEGFRASIETLMQNRFPDLVALAMERIEHMQDSVELQNVLLAMSFAQDECDARCYLLALPNNQ